MDKTEAVQLLARCKPLAERLCGLTSEAKGKPETLNLSMEEYKALQGYSRVLDDPVTAGPGLLGRLLKEAQLSQVETYKLEQFLRLIHSKKITGNSNQ